MVLVFRYATYEETGDDPVHKAVDIGIRGLIRIEFMVSRMYIELCMSVMSTLSPVFLTYMEKVRLWANEIQILVAQLC
jgi:hypothetical protein